jgi:hypothetical protein
MLDNASQRGVQLMKGLVSLADKCVFGNSQNNECMLTCPAARVLEGRHAPLCCTTTVFCNLCCCPCKAQFNASLFGAVFA